MLRVEKFGYTHNFFIGFDSKYRDFLSIFFHFFYEKICYTAYLGKCNRLLCCKTYIFICIEKKLVVSLQHLKGYITITQYLK